ncbi:MAG: aspartate--tRNA ligase [Candidatus Wildermuthbacteria bacterium]|nr:aspartate--tRNA ligase [Candidatus Wildermuthbacteria bacterium]
MQRTYTAETPNKVGETVKLAGWIDTRRDHGKLVFLDLRDKEGIMQIVFTPQEAEAHGLVQEARPEWVVEIEGEVKERPENMKNKEIATGGVELLARKLVILSQAKTMPFDIHGDGYDIDEEKRLTYRYLDLRRPRMAKNLKMRHLCIQFMRDFLLKEGFTEVETPVISKSTPEGARDYLIPSRLYAGKFYALPQSPQQYKQLLQVAGVEKYFQIVRCFRDEDPRADRQPEFTQLDIEMSFVEQEDVLNLIERLYTQLVGKFFPEKRVQKSPFPRYEYKDVMAKYNSDKPDLRENAQDPNELAFAFVVNFPMFEWKEKEDRWDAVHHPFTRPQTEDLEEMKKNPGDILAFQYDLVLNGYEIAGGSLRTYRPDILSGVFELMGNKKEDIQAKFGHLLTAFEYGVPPHGGIASGLDRFFAISFGEPNIREVIPFPKTGDARDPLMDSPSEVTGEQLKELHLEITKKK